MDQIERIKKYTEIFEDQTKGFKKLEKALDDFEENAPLFKELVDYYYSEDFEEDFEASNRGELPKDLNQGILTEDAIYDLISQEYEASLKLLDLANRMIQRK